MKRIMILALLLAGLAGAIGCNTVRGAGRDVERVGEEVQRAID